MIKLTIFLFSLIFTQNAMAFDLDAPSSDKRLIMALPVLPLKLGPSRALIIGAGYLGDYRMQGNIPGDRYSRPENSTSIHKRSNEFVKQLREPDSLIISYRISF